MAEKVFAIASALGLAAGSAWYLPRMGKFFKEHVHIEIDVQFTVKSSADSASDSSSNSDASSDE